MTLVLKTPDISEQLATAGAASRAREVRDQKVFVKSLFTELDQQKKEIAVLKEMLHKVLEKLDAKAEKKAAKAE